MTLNQSGSVAFAARVRMPSSIVDGFDAWTIDFSPNDLTMIRCSCSQGPWCIHRAEVLKVRADVPGLHEWFSMIEETDILVPVLPSQEIYLAVRLRHAGRGISMVDANRDVFYGVIAEYEGLNDMRQLYMDNLQSRMNVQDFPVCKGSHGIRAQREADKIRSEGRSKGQWVTYNIQIDLIGMCPTCKRTENYDDLVPDVPATAGRRSPFNAPPPANSRPSSYEPWR